MVRPAGERVARRATTRVGVCFALLVSVCALVAPPRTARAEGPVVRRVRNLYQRLYFAEAAKVCAAALRRGKLARAELLQLLRMQGLIAAASGRDDRAKNAFARLLALDPRASLAPGHPPRVSRAFRRARASLAGAHLTLALRAPRRAPFDRPLPISVALRADPLRQVDHAQLYLRAEGTRGRWQRLRRPRTDLRWRVDPRTLTAGRVARVGFFVVVRDSHGNVLAQLGSAERPRSMVLMAPTAERRPAVTGTPWYRRWWVWTAVGAVVVGSAVALGVTLSRPADTVDAPIVIESR